MMHAKDERARNEAEIEQAAKESDASIRVYAPMVASDHEAGASIIRLAPTDDEVIDAVMEKFGMSFGQACDRILALVENMTVVA